MSDLGLGHFDHINQKITLAVITLSVFHCIYKKLFLVIFWSKMITVTVVLITINVLFSRLIYYKGMGLGQSDYINWMITLSVITLSGFYCTVSCLATSIKLFFQNQKQVNRRILICWRKWISLRRKKQKHSEILSKEHIRSTIFNLG